MDGGDKSKSHQNKLQSESKSFITSSPLRNVKKRSKKSKRGSELPQYPSQSSSKSSSNPSSSSSTVSLLKSPLRSSLTSPLRSSASSSTTRSAAPRKRRNLSASFDNVTRKSLDDIEEEKASVSVAVPGPSIARKKKLTRSSTVGSLTHTHRTSTGAGSQAAAAALRTSRESLVDLFSPVAAAPSGATVASSQTLGDDGPERSSSNSVSSSSLHSRRPRRTSSLMQLRRSVQLRRSSSSTSVVSINSAVAKSGTTTATTRKVAIETSIKRDKDDEDAKDAERLLLIEEDFVEEEEEEEVDGEKSQRRRRHRRRLETSEILESEAESLRWRASAQTGDRPLASALFQEEEEEEEEEAAEQSSDKDQQFHAAMALGRISTILSPVKSRVETIVEGERTGADQIVALSSELVVSKEEEEEEELIEEEEEEEEFEFDVSHDENEEEDNNLYSDVAAAAMAQAAAVDDATPASAPEEGEEEEELFDPFYFLKCLPPRETQQAALSVQLPPRAAQHADRVTLVLDLDETLVHCFDESQELLTNFGFLTLSEVTDYLNGSGRDLSERGNEAREEVSSAADPWRGLRVASFDHQSGSLVYETPLRLICSKEGVGLVGEERQVDAEKMIAFENANSEVSVLVTPGHDMFVSSPRVSRKKKRSFRKVKARNLLDKQTPAPSSHSSFSFLTAAPNGIAAPSTSGPSKSTIDFLCSVAYQMIGSGRTRVSKSSRKFDVSLLAGQSLSESLFWSLSAAESRSLLFLLVHETGAVADFDDADDISFSLFTCDESLRDQTVRLALHAGFSPVVKRFPTAASAVAETAEQQLTCAQATTWAIEITSTCTTSMTLAEDITSTRPALGRRWCFEMPSGFVIARRIASLVEGGICPLAARDERPALAVHSSRPVIHGNCSTDELEGGADLHFPVLFNNVEYKVFVRRRPNMERFLRAVAQHFEVVVFTASQRVYADRLLDILDPSGDLIHHRLFRDSCIYVEGNFLKDLTVLGRELSRVAIVDNSPQVFGYQLDNGVPIETWFDDNDDDELMQLLPFLEEIAKAEEDVRPLIRNRFRLHELVAQSQPPSTAVLQNQ